MTIFFISYLKNLVPLASFVGLCDGSELGFRGQEIGDRMGAGDGWVGTRLVEVSKLQNEPLQNFENALEAGISGTTAHLLGWALA